MKLISFSDLKEKKGVCFTRRHIQRLRKEAKFPEPVRLTDFSIAWLESEVDEWIAARAAERPQKVAA